MSSGGPAGPPGPVGDGDVPAFWSGLGLPGLIDTHVHFLPAPLLDRVWQYFADGGPLLGRCWPVTYRWPEEQRLAHLRAMGVRAFPSLVYPHRPGMAGWLNGWAAEFAGRVPECLQTATFFPEPGVDRYVADALAAGARLCKVHVQVGGFDPRDALLEPVWGMLAEAAVPVVVHAGGGPVPGRFTGPEPFRAVLARHPRLTAVIAHLGMPEYGAFLALADRYRNVHLDTTMAFTGFTEEAMPFPRELLPRLAALEPRLLLGSDFPNIPYPYAHQLQVLAALGFGDGWLRSVCYRNAARLFGLDSAAGPT